LRFFRMFGKNIQWKQALSLYYCALRSSQRSSGNSAGGGGGQALSAKPGAASGQALSAKPGAVAGAAGSDFKARWARPGAGGGAGACAMLAALCGPFPGKKKPAG
jgi:hypothetical protein